MVDRPYIRWRGAPCAFSQTYARGDRVLIACLRAAPINQDFTAGRADMVAVNVAGGPLASQQGDTLVIEVSEGQKRLTGAAAQVDSALGGVVTEMLRSGLI